MNYNEVCFHHPEIKKRNTYISTRCLIFNEGPKRWFLLTFTFSNLSSTLIWNARLVPKMAFARYFVAKPPKPHVAICNMGLDKRCALFWSILAVGLILTHDLEYWFLDKGKTNINFLKLAVSKFFQGWMYEWASNTIFMNQNFISINQSILYLDLGGRQTGRLMN